MSRYESLEDQVEDLATYAVNFSDVHYNTTEKTVCNAWVSCGHGDPGMSAGITCGPFSTSRNAL